jgi:hypothetical protein
MNMNKDEILTKVALGQLSVEEAKRLIKEIEPEDSTCPRGIDPEKPRPTSERSGKLSQPLNVGLWIASAVIAFCFIPYVDVFSGYGARFDPPDLAKPLLFGAFGTVVIRAIAGAFCGERLLD